MSNEEAQTNAAGGQSVLTDGLAPTTLCWNCNMAYPMETHQCPGCCATNANKDMESAQEGRQDKRLIDHDGKWVGDWYGDPDVRNGPAKVADMGANV